MKLTIYVCLAAILLMLGSTEGEEKSPIPGIGPVGKVQELHTDLNFTEGPAGETTGNLFFSDIPANRIYKRDYAGTLAIAIEPSRQANGLMFDGTGHLVACEMNGALVLHNLASGKRQVLTDEFEKSRYNAPNDLVIDKQGGVYFTDPRYSAPRPWPQGKEAFYYRAANGQVTRLGDDLEAPNGIMLSPDEQTLYVVASMQKEVMAYAVEVPGKLGPPRILCSLILPPGAKTSDGDGLTVDTNGNLYVTSKTGIQVVSPDGTILGTIELPQQPANVTFGGPHHQTLFVTARTSLYAIPMEAKGHVFSGVVAADE